MSKRARSYCTTANRSLILAIAGTVFLSIAAAGTSAAEFSLLDAIRGALGISSPSTSDAPLGNGPEFINEVLFNPPGTDGPNEYVEIRGIPNSTIPAGRYLVGIEGDSGNPGDVQTIFDLSGLTIGSNGYLLIRQMSNTYTVDPAATSIVGTGTGFTGAAGFLADSGTDIENSSASFLLIEATTAPTLADDIDSDNDGVADGIIYAGWIIIDPGAGVVDAATDSAYTPVVYSTSPTFVGSAGRDVVVTNTAMGYVARQGTAMGNTSASDWFAGALGGSAPNWTMTVGDSYPAGYDGQALNHLGALNPLPAGPTPTPTPPPASPTPTPPPASPTPTPPPASPTPTPPPPSGTTDQGRETEPNDTTANADVLVGAGGRIRGSIFSGIAAPAATDTDFYSITTTVPNAKVYAATINMSSAGQDTILAVIASDGTTVLESDNNDGSFGATSSSIAGTVLAAPGTYYLRVTNNSVTSPVAVYDLYFAVRDPADLVAETEPNDNGNPQAIPASEFVSGEINPATDTDTFTFSANAGDTVFLSLDLDPERDLTTFNGRIGIGVFGTPGAFLVTSDAGTGDTIDSEAMVMTVKATGTYTVYVDAQAAGTASYNFNVAKIAEPSRGSCTTYTNSTPTAIADLALTSSTISIPDSKIIKSLRVTTDITHANFPDLDVHLRSPSNNDNGLFTDIGVATQTGPQIITMDDDAALPLVFTITNGVIWRPEPAYRLNWFKGENAQGIWTLDIRDDLTANAGTLNSWSIEVCEEPAPTGTVVYSEDFEAGMGGYTHAGAADEWEYGTPATAAQTTTSPFIAAFIGCASGNNCWKTDLDNTYDPSSNQELTSPPINLTAVTAPMNLYWMQRYQMETTTFDRMWVKVTEVGNPANTRMIWHADNQTMGEANGSGASAANLPESAGWGRYAGDISDFAGTIVQVTFHLESDSSIMYGGWAVDDVSIRGTAGGSTPTPTPPPASPTPTPTPTPPPASPTPTPTPPPATPTPTPPPATPTPTPNPSPSPTCPPGGGVAQVVPPAYTSTQGTSTFTGPLANAARTYQLLINANQLTGLVGQQLTGLTWRLPVSATVPWPAADVNFANYDIRLSESVAPALRSLTFANNVVGPQTLVRSGPLTVTTNSYPSGGTPNAFGPDIAFNTPWLYAGGHLLIEIRHDGFTGTSRSVDAIGTAIAGYGTDFSAAWTASYTGLTGGQGNFSIARLTAGGGGCPTPTPSPGVTPTPSPTPPPATPTPTPPPATPTPSPGGTPEIRFGAQTYYCNESMNGVITLVRNFNTTGTNTVNLVTSNGTAVGGAAPGVGIDYQNVNTNVTFLPTEASKNVNVPCYGDTLTEATETVNLTLSGPFTRPGGGDEDDGTTAAAPEVQNAVLNIIDTASAWRFTNPICVTLGGTADAYPAPITVPNGPASIAGMRVTLYDLSYTFPDHIDALLVGPGGQKFVMMGDAGGALPIPPGSPVTLSFRDIGPGVLPNSGPLVTGNFEPTTWETPVTNFPGPAPAGPYSEPGSTIGGTGTQTFAGNFGGTNANGVWNLWIRDDAGVPLAPEAISGCINGGWGLEFLSTTAANASISGRVLTADGRPIRNVTVTVTGNSLSAPRVVQTGSFGYYNFDDLRTGETYVITVQGRRYFFQMPSQIVSLTDNIADLNFIAVPDDSQNQ